MSRIAATVAMLLCCSSQSAEISGPSEVQACGGLVRLSCTIEESHTVAWQIIAPRGLDCIFYNSNQSLAFAAPSKSQTVVVQLTDVWTTEEGLQIEHTYHDVKVGQGGPTPPDDPVDPDDPPDNPDVIPPGINGIARVAWVESRKIATYKSKVDDLADLYGSIAAQISAGTLNSVTSVSNAIKNGTTETLGDELNAWARWRGEIDNKFSELASVGLLVTLDDWSAECRNVERGLRGDRPKEVEPPKESETKTPPKKPSTESIKFTIERDGKRRFAVTEDGRMYLINETTKPYPTFCAQDRCYQVKP